MKHLRIFEKGTDYQSFKVSADYIEPNVSVVKELATSEAIKYNPIVVLPNVISFTVDGVAFQADRGMNWVEWVNSSYNTVNAGFGVADVFPTVRWSNGKMVAINGEGVSCNHEFTDGDEIIENGVYTTRTPYGPW
jgi:hypothetical protein